MHSSTRSVKHGKKVRGVKANVAKENEAPVKDTHITGEESPWRKGVNAFPTGRQLPRTPPGSAPHHDASTAGQRLDGQVSLSAVQLPRGRSCLQLYGTSAAAAEPPGHEDSSYPAREAVLHDARVADPTLHGPGMRSDRARRHSTVSATAAGDMDPDCFVRGMQGYQWTTADLEFVEHTKYERQVRQLKAELCMLLKQLKDERQRQSLAQATRERVQSDIAEALDFKRLLQLGREVVERMVPTGTEAHVEPESLLAQLCLVDVQRVTQEERANCALLAQELASLHELYSKEQQYHENTSQNRILQKQANVDALKKELSDLKKQLSEAQGRLRSTQSQVASLKAPTRATKEEEVDMPRVLRSSKRIAQRKERFLEREAVLRKISDLKL